ncbi:organic hydroperoxide resistance protein [Geodermatophilus ruber]|uniref:Peroxiredoxin, Ohr subfamily n=1 Tax=Geodermatophilus ruber TaxID=504800 RepID=A0A1I4GLA7_9ACTN|nr:organic hydroperoxide resistance protein [Geodermatophilus ruber]SFL30669.1 peroxiredoxin, Ohr subfamily [Geodermatophilus ruber]
MRILYSTAATARGGRDGEVVSDDGILDLELASPVELGGPGGDRTNPEQLFAAGYAACFSSTLQHVAGKRELDVAGLEVTAKVGLAHEGGVSDLAVTLVVAFPSSVTAEQGEELVEAAHQMCPYSRATRGNVEVTLQVAERI